MVVAHGDTVEPIVETLMGHGSLSLGDAHYDDLFEITIPAGGSPRLMKLGSSRFRVGRLMDK